LNNNSWRLIPPGDAAVQDLIDDIREHVPAMFKVCEAIAMLDMILAFAQLVTSQDYGNHSLSCGIPPSAKAF